MDKSADVTLAEFTKSLAGDEPRGGAAAALAGALAAALAARAVAGEEAAAKLERIRTYMLHLVDEDVKALKPLEKYLALPEDDPGRGAHLDAALRVACYIPTEVMYTAVDAAETLAAGVESCPKGALADAAVALELCRAAMRASRVNIVSHAAHMADEVFGMTLRRECELVRGKYEPIIDAALAAIEERF